MTQWIVRAPPRAWSPTTFVARIAGETLDAFCAQFDSLYFLIVRLDDFSSELAAGLSATDYGAAPGRPRRATISLLHHDLSTEVVGVDGAQTPPKARPSVRASDEFAAMPDLLGAACHVLEIKKSKAAPPVGMITVGRAPENEIVLQHASVSRMHAQFEYADGLRLTDVGSSNRTFVNGVATVGWAPLVAGDVINFGAVRCAVCSPAGLWRAVHG